MTWSSNLDPPSTPMFSRFLGSVLCPIFGQSLCSIGDDHVMTGRPYTIVGVKADQADSVTEHPTASYKDWTFRIKVASTLNYRGPSNKNMPAPRSMSAPPTMAAKTTERAGRKKARKNKESDSDSGSEESEESPKRKWPKGKAKDKPSPLPSILICHRTRHMHTRQSPLGRPQRHQQHHPSLHPSNHLI